MADIGTNVGSDVVVLGRVTKIGAGGNTVELTTFDNTKINITVPNIIEAKPINILEAWGIVKSKGATVATQCVLFDEQHCTDFDSKMYHGS